MTKPQDVLRVWLACRLLFRSDLLSYICIYINFAVSLLFVYKHDICTYYKYIFIYVYIHNSHSKIVSFCFSFPLMVIVSLYMYVCFPFLWDITLISLIVFYSFMPFVFSFTFGFTRFLPKFDVKLYWKVFFLDTKGPKIFHKTLVVWFWFVERGLDSPIPCVGFKDRHYYWS